MKNNFFLLELDKKRTQKIGNLKKSICVKISNKIVNSPYKYRLRKKSAKYLETSLARIPRVFDLRYYIYHCLYDMGYPVFLGLRLHIYMPHDTNNGDFIVGSNVKIGDDCMIDYSGGVVLEDYASLSDRVTLYSHNHPTMDKRWIGMMPHHIKYYRVRIREHAWIGTGSIILPNTEYIGKYATVAAGSVVTRNVPDYAIVSGNPARIVGYKEKD